MASQGSKLHRELGILDVTAITAGIVIGAGVFIVTGIAAKYAGALTWLAYAFGIIPVLLVGLSTIFLNFLYQVEGGESYVYPTRIVSKPLGFLSGWGMWLALIGPVAITAQAFISYLNALPGIPFQAPVIAGAVIVTIVFFVLNWIGIKAVSLVQNILFIFMVAGIVIYILIGLPKMSLANIKMGSPMGFAGVMKATSLLIFSYAGLTLAADLGEEAKDPAKTITWGIMLGALIPAVLYVGSAFVSTAVLPWEQFAASDAPYAAVASEFLGAFGVTFIVLVAWAAILSSHNGEQAVGARILFGLTRDKIFGGKILSINKFGVPGFALIITVGVALFLIITGGIQLVAEIIVAMFLYNWIITHVGVLMSPKRYPELYRNLPGFYRSKGFMIVPILGIVVSVYLLILQGWKAIGYGIIWMAIGLVIYYIGYSKNKQEIDRLMSEWPKERYLE